MGQFKYGGNFKGNIVNLIPTIFEQMVHNAPINTPPPLSPYAYTASPSSSLFSYLTHPPKPTHTASISLTPSPVNRPSTTISSGFHRRIPLETTYQYAPLSQTLTVKLLTVLVAFQVVVRFLSNLSYMSDIHVIEYLGFWFGGLIC